MTGETEIVRNYESGDPARRQEREIAWRNILITDEAGRAQGRSACGIDITDPRPPTPNWRGTAPTPKNWSGRTTQLAEARPGRGRPTAPRAPSSPT